MRDRGALGFGEALARHCPPPFLLAQELPKATKSPEIAELSVAKVLKHGDRGKDEQITRAWEAAKLNLLQNQGRDTDENAEGERDR